MLPAQEVARTVFWAIAQHNSRHMSHEEKVYLRGRWPGMNNLEDNVIDWSVIRVQQTIKLSICKRMHVHIILLF